MENHQNHNDDLITIMAKMKREIEAMKRKSEEELNML